MVRLGPVLQAMLRQVQPHSLRLVRVERDAGECDQGTVGKLRFVRKWIRCREVHLGDFVTA